MVSWFAALWQKMAENVPNVNFLNCELRFSLFPDKL